MEAVGGGKKYQPMTTILAWVPPWPTLWQAKADRGRDQLPRQRSATCNWYGAASRNKHQPSRQSIGFTIDIMVSTRGHPKEFADPVLSPSKQPGARGRKAKWVHTPSNLMLIWLAISLPLVIWDTGYVLLRPHSMPGGWAHSPLWVPYDLYGRVDHVYGWKAYNAGNGFTAAQGIMNTCETCLYFYYLYIMYVYGKQTAAPGRGAPKPAKVGALGESRYVDGKMAGLAVTVAFAAAVMTLSKTILYCLGSYFLLLTTRLILVRAE
jgi:hypothetical protein